MNQVAFYVIGNDMTITMAAEAGQLELNAFEPIIFYCMFQSIDTLAYAVQTFVDNCIKGITANETRCRYLVENSVGIITAICPHIGYQKAADVAKKAIQTGESVRTLILQEGLLEEEELDSVGIITAICPHIGYQKAADVAKKAIQTGESVRTLILQEGLLEEEELDCILDPENMTEPGISGKELMKKNI